MAHVIESAASGRSRCRGCSSPITKGDLRFGERLPNPYDDGNGDMTLWFHLKCAAYRRPEPLLETLTASTEQIEHTKSLTAICQFASAYRRVPRVGCLERASSGRARCRECRQPIDKGRLRIPLVFYQEGVFNTSGFVHLTCAAAYFGTADLLDCICHFAGDLCDADLLELKDQLSR